MTLRHALVAARRRGAMLAVLLLALGTLACGGDDDDAADDLDSGAREPAAAPGGTVDLALGEQVYQGNCARCHGEDLRGTDRGPSQLSIVYEPSHHTDQSYVAAITQGAASHHWEFGDMPPVEGLDDDEIASVIGYIRSVQEAEGFEEYPPAG